MSDADSSPSLTEEPRRRVRLLVAYDGTHFAGFARNDGVRTVAGVLEDALVRILREPIKLTGAGRTDRGVHAAGQVVTFDTASPRLDVTRLGRSLNGLCGPEIAVRDVAVVDDSFDARFSAKWRRYRYTILRSEAPDPFRAAYSWHLPAPLDVDAIRAASAAFVGQHDFSSFCRRPPAPAGGAEPSLVRTVTELSWTEPGDELRLEITAVAFCHQMVRSITGTLVAVGRGRLAAADIPSILAARDRNAAGDLAPPQGLCLWEVGY